MSKEDVLICDRCDAVVRGVSKAKDAKSDFVVQVRADIGVLAGALSLKQDSSVAVSTAVEAAAFVDLCDECRDTVADLMGQIFKIEK